MKLIGYLREVSSKINGNIILRRKIAFQTTSEKLSCKQAEKMSMRLKTVNPTMGNENGQDL